MAFKMTRTLIRVSSVIEAKDLSYNKLEFCIEI